MKNKLTKLEQLFEESDYGVMSATGALSKMLRGFWKDIGLTHLHINQLIDKWLEDPSNEYEQDPTKINNARGNVRKDKEKDDSTWKVFLRNLRILRPQEVRFLVRLKFKNGSSYRQVATMRPRSTNQFNSDQIINTVKWSYIDEDQMLVETPEHYDDEGFTIGEKYYVGSGLIAQKETDEGYWGFTNEELYDHVSKLKSNEFFIETFETQSLFNSVSAHVQNTWKHEMANHLRRIANADPSYDIISHEDFITDGHHRIVRAWLMGIPELKVKRIYTLPETKFYPKNREMAVIKPSLIET